ncbi:MAG TPA: hypothetical protein ENJ29_05445 [Bacteroidetes bacterium]|nr:hypothetical protein [Bacteroidota bacterium]
MIFRFIKMRMTWMIKVIFFYTGVFALIRKFRPNRKLAILRYHAVVDGRDNYYASPSISISRRQFERHVRYFAKNYTIISLDEAVKKLRAKKPLPANAVVFTFDDGYADNFYAHEILKKYGGTGTFYLTAECIDRKEPFWLSEVIYLFLHGRRNEASIHLDDEVYEYKLDNKLKKWRAIQAVVALIKSNNRDVRERIRKQLRDQLEPADFERKLDAVMLTWDQVRTMHEAGMTMAAHTLTHLNLPNAEPEDALHEISGCKKLLEEKLQAPVLHFSYPNSGPYKYYTEEIRDMVEKSGYLSSTTSYAGFADENSDFFAIRRVRTVSSLVETVAGLELSKL